MNTELTTKFSKIFYVTCILEGIQLLLLHSGRSAGVRWKDERIWTKEERFMSVQTLAYKFWKVYLDLQKEKVIKKWAETVVNSGK